MSNELFDCIKSPGYFIEVAEGSAWLTKDGSVTTEWNERGLWETREQARRALMESMNETSN